MTVDFMNVVGAVRYHDTDVESVVTTVNGDSADDYAAAQSAVFRITKERWPKSVNKLKKKIRYMYKEAGERNFLVVVLP